jgi:hypothetical protein
VRPLNPVISDVTWGRLLTPRDGQPLDNDW